MEAPAAIHLVVVKGVARVTADGQSRILDQGMSTAISEKGVVSVENMGDQPIYLIQILS
jgi:mannose-6-phosphate isomerase-like protein (cupin superfamily)